jgi:hypothetical protein
VKIIEVKILKFKNSHNRKKCHQLRINQPKRVKRNHQLTAKLFQHLNLWNKK